MEENTPGVTNGIGISGDIFGMPTGEAWQGLKLILGDWIELIYLDSGAGSATIMTHVAGYINYLAYILITVIIGYTVISAVVNTAATGKIAGNKVSMVWLPLRTFLAVALLFPVGIGHATTISLSQYFAVRLTLTGSNAADRVAEFLYTYIQRNAFDLDVTANGYKAIQDMTQMAFCAEGFRIMNNKQGNPYNDPGEFYGYVRASNNLGASNASTARLSYSERPVIIHENIARQGYKTVDIGFRGMCGSLAISADRNNEKEMAIAEDLLAVSLKYLSRVYNEVVRPQTDVTSSSRMLTEGMLQPHLNGFREINETFNTTIQAKLNLVSEYENEISNVILKHANSDENSLVELSRSGNNHVVSIRQNETNKKLGWAYMGIYYNLLSKEIGDIKSIAALSNNITTAFEVDGCEFDIESQTGSNWYQFWKSKENSNDCDFTKIYSMYMTYKDTAGAIARSSGNDAYAIQGACTNAKNCDPNVLEPAFARKITQAFMMGGGTDASHTNRLAHDAIFGWWGSGDVTLGMNYDAYQNPELALGAFYISDPIAHVSTIGHSILYEAHLIRITVRFLTGLVEGFGNTGIPGFGAVFAVVGGVLGAVVDTISTTLMILYPNAATMAYLIPLLPSLMVGMAFLSWLILAVEALFGAPLAVVLMATPEGEGIAGSRMERKIAMLAALVLKPAFIMAGMLLSMMMLSVSYIYMNQIYWASVGSSFGGEDPIRVVALIVIWTGMIVTLFHNIFKLPITFSDSLLEWMAGGLARSFGNNVDNAMSDQFKGSASETQRLGAGFGAVGKFGGNSAGSYLKEKFGKKEGAKEKE